jgi:hypothetical protein
MKFEKGLTLVSALAISMALGGCSGASDEAADETMVDSPLTGVDDWQAYAKQLAGPPGTFFAQVKANGSGCPAGTWDASIAPDGQTFTVTFSQYEVSVNPGQLLSMKDCALGIRLHSPQGYSYAVGDFYYSGYAYLDRAGMKGRQTTKYYFQGNPAPADSASKLVDIAGPYDSDFVFQEQVGITDQVWSACGTERDLNVQSRLRLLNDPRKKGTGIMNTLSVDGNVQLQFHLSWKKC